MRVAGETGEPLAPTELCLADITLRVPPLAQVAAGAVRPEGVEAFLKMGGALDIAAVRKKPKEWVPGEEVGRGRVQLADAC